MTESKQDTHEGLPPNEEDKFYIAWGRESLKDNLKFVNEVLRQLVTLNSALLGGSVAFLDEKVIAVSLKIWIMLAFFISLVISFIGMMPYTGYISLVMPQTIKKYKEKALKTKLKILRCAGFVLFLGFLLIGIGMLYRLRASP